MYEGKGKREKEKVEWMLVERINIMGAVVALFILVTCNLIFVARLSHLPRTEYWLGVAFLTASLPLVYLLISAKGYQRAPLYYIQIGIMLSFMVAELMLDYIFQIEFRRIRWMVILYVILFFGGTGGMIGIASQAGRIWTVSAVILFLIMTFLAFWQRAKTGM